MHKLLFHKLLYEYQTYCSDVLSRSKLDIFDKCDEIDAIVNIYEILMEKICGMSDELAVALLQINGLLHHIYSGWLKKDDGCWIEPEGHVKNELELINNRERIIMGEAV